MIIERTFDIDLIKSVMFIDEIWNAVTEDGCTKEQYEPNLQTVIWLTIKDGENIIALGSLDIMNGVTLRGHPLVIPEFRGQSLSIMHEVFKWFINTEHKYQKLIAEVPELYPNVIAFAERSGFNKEGIRTMSHLKDGELCNVHLYGVTKSELKERFNHG